MERFASGKRFEVGRSSYGEGEGVIIWAREEEHAAEQMDGVFGIVNGSIRIGLGKGSDENIP